MRGRDVTPRTFGELVRAEEDDSLDLAEAALAIAAAEYDGVDVGAYLLRLDAYAGRALAHAGHGASQRVKLDALSRELFDVEGFRGNLEDYYDSQNSYFNRVLDRRVGIPISLSLLYLEVGRRMDLPLVGVGLPGHFLVKLAGAHEEVLVDPFYQGAVLGRAECQQRLDAIYGGKVVLTEQFLRAVSKREVLARMLYNLKRIHLRAGDATRQLRVLDMLLELQPFSLEDVRDRGLVRYRSGAYKDALPDLRQYLSVWPAARDAADVQRAVAACERAHAEA
jgi:regulator of sirC expression with transglutaminase-like and TPR domain